MDKVFVKFLNFTVLLLFVTMMNVNAQVIVSIPDTTGVQDSTVSIPVIVDLKSYGVTCYEFELTFDPQVLTATEVGASNEETLTENWHGPFVNTNFDGKIIVGGFFSPTDTIYGTGNFVNLNFTICGNIGDSTELVFNYFIFNNGMPYAYKMSGLLKVVEPIPASVDINAVETPSNVILFPNYPNPFKLSTQISYCLNKKQHVSISIFNLLGQEIITLKNKEQTPNYYSLQWDGKDVFGNQIPTGLYYCVLKTDNMISTEKLLFIK